MRRQHAHRGLSVSALVAMCLPILIVLMGLAVDTTFKTYAQRKAAGVAARAARAATNAWGPSLAVGEGNLTAALEAARQAANQNNDVEYTISVVDEGTILIETSTTHPTFFLSVIGINEVVGRATAQAQLIEP